MRWALIGTRGVPARYGGFETAVEEVGRRLVAKGHEVVVFCRGLDDDRSDDEDYLGMRRVVLPALRRRSLETLSHTALSVLHRSLAHVDAAILFNAANAPLLPVLRARRIPVATHVDGLEWKRAKWGPTGQRYYRWAEALSVRWSDALIADAAGIADYYRVEFGAPSVQIAYGAPILVEPQTHRLNELGLSRGSYHLVVARFEPENHVLEIVRGFVRSRAELPLAVVGSAPYADEYTRAIEAAADQRVRLLGGVWDQDLLDALYAGSLTYLHGHSVGGTNPSLLRAGGAGAAVIAYDVGFNREVLGASGVYFGGEEELAEALERAESAPAATRERGDAVRRGMARYDWDAVATAYEALLMKLAESGPSRSRQRPSGRRTVRS